MLDRPSFLIGSANKKRTNMVPSFSLKAIHNRYAYIGVMTHFGDDIKGFFQ